MDMVSNEPKKVRQSGTQRPVCLVLGAGGAARAILDALITRKRQKLSDKPHERTSPRSGK